MKVTVLGASGGCGRWILKLAKDRGHQVRAVIREKTQFEVPPGVQVIRGSVLEENILAESLDDCDAVLSALGIKRKNPLNPWSVVESPGDLTTQVAKSLVYLMPGMNVKRFVGISAGGVRDSFHKTNSVLQWLILNSNMKVSYEDLAKMESTFEQSSIDWMTVRPVTLTGGSPNREVKQINYYRFFDRIKRSEVATWMLDQAEDAQPFSNRTPMIKSS